jgi:hypothetical protein
MKAWVSILALAIFSAASAQTASAPASEPTTQPIRHLTFETVPISEAITWLSGDPPEQIIQPTHAAVVAIAQDRQDGAREDEWLKRAGSEMPGISPQQEAFLRQRVHTSLSSRRGTARSPWLSQGSYKTSTGQWSPYSVYIFFAVSEQDARRMATLFIDHLDEQAQRRLTDTQRTLQESVEMLEQVPPHIEEYNAREKQAMERIASLAGEPLIRPDAWRKAIGEGKATLKGLEIERTGQLARLRKIQEYLGERATPRQAAQSPTTQPNPTVFTALETMLVELNVEMAGTQAKIDAVEKDIAPFRELLHLADQKDEAYKQGLDWQRKLDQARQNVQNLPQTLADPPIRMQPVQVKDYTVRIVPVRPAPTSQSAD